MLDMLKEHPILTLVCFVLVFGLMVPCFVARYALHIRPVFISFCSLFYAPIHTLAEWLRGCFDSGKAWLRNQIAGFSADGSTDKILSYIIGAILYAAFGCFLVVCEIPLVTFTLEAWGFTGVAEKLGALSLMDAGVCVASVIILSSVVWGALLFDTLGITHFAPILHKFKKIGRICILVVCSIGFTVSVAGLVAMAYYRGEITSSSIEDFLASPVDAAVSSQSLENETPQTTSQPTDFETLASAETFNAIQADPETSSATPPSLPELSHFAIRIPVVVFTATAISMSVLSAITLTAGSAVLLWLGLGLFFLLNSAIGLGFALFHSIDLILERIIDNMMRVLELLIAYGSSLLHLINIEPGEQSILASANSNPAPSTTPPSAPAHDAPNPAVTPEGESAEPTPRQAHGFDPFG